MICKRKFSELIIFDIIYRMTSENQKSFLSQVTLDSSKINKQSLSTSVLPPLHTGESSYIVYKHKKSSKNHNRPLPFGSTSSRVIEQLEPKLSTHIVGYESIQSKFKDVSENRISPFGTSECRFKEISNRSPGPGVYQSEKINTIQQSHSSWQFSKDSRDLSKQAKSQMVVGPGSYEPSQCKDSYKFRQKMAEKYRQHKKKYVQSFARIAQKHHEDVKPTNFAEENDVKSSPNAYDNKKKDLIHEKVKEQTPLNRFLLKDSTKKYVMKNEKENSNHQCDPPCSIYKNFTYNFIEKSDDAFASYIPKDKGAIPGPGYYPQTRLSPKPITESSNFKSGSLRSVFPTAKFPVKREKAKLSELL